MLLAIALIAATSLVLGMGLPVTASSIVLATLSAPALFQLMADAELVRVLASAHPGAEAAVLIGLSLPDAVATLGNLGPEQATGLSRRSSSDEQHGSTR